MFESISRSIVSNGLLGEIVTRPVRPLQPGEALLRVHATSLNFHDLVGIDGGIPGLPIPRVPCSDASAIVEAVGVGVSEISPGDAVIPSFFAHWRSGPVNAAALSVILGDQVDGTLQSRVVVPAASLSRAPAGLSHEAIATLGCAGLTAWRSLVVEGAIKPGQTVVLQGTGGVSLMALGFAKMVGARAIITSSSDAKLERARALGADVTINYRSTPDWAGAVREATDGLGADLVVEVGGGATLNQAVGAVRVGGHISIIGVLSGWRAPDFRLAEVMSRNITLRGITVGSTEDLSAMCRAIEQHQYQPIIDNVYDLAATQEALTAMREQRHFGKIVVRIDDSA